MTDSKMTQIARALGVIDGTLGSPRNYTANDLRRRLEMVSAILRLDNEELEHLGRVDLVRQGELDAELESVN